MISVRSVLEVTKDFAASLTSIIPEDTFMRRLRTPIFLDPESDDRIIRDFVAYLEFVSAEETGAIRCQGNHEEDGSFYEGECVYCGAAV